MYQQRMWQSSKLLFLKEKDNFDDKLKELNVNVFLILLM